MNLRGTPADELRIILSKDKTKREINNIRRDVLLEAADTVNEDKQRDPDCDDEWFINSHPPRENCGIRDYVRSERCRYQEVLQRNVCDLLPKPHSITIADLTRLFFEHLCVGDNEFDDAYERFRIAACGMAEDLRKTAPFPIAHLARGPAPGIPPKKIRQYLSGEIPETEWKVLLREYDKFTGQLGLDTFDPGTVIWRNSYFPDGPSLEVVGMLPAAYCSHGQRREEVVVYAALEGQMSRNAAKQASAELKPLVRSAHKSFTLVFLQSSSPLDYPTLRPLKNDEAGRWYCFIKECVDVYYSAQPKKSDLRNRLRNGLHLLVEADRQNRSAISFALCISALEALLGENSAGISKTLAENVAVLLEPDRKLRCRAIDKMKDLYNKRSRILHGDDVEDDLQALENTRLVAAACVNAMLQRRRAFRSTQAIEETSQQFLKELQRAHTEAEGLDGVSEMPPVRALWQS